MKNTLRFVCLATLKRCLLYVAVIFSFFMIPDSALAQSQIVELFVRGHCAANDVAEGIVQKLNAAENTSGVLVLTCNLANKSCDKRRSLYTRRKVLRRYSTPTSVFNGRYDVTAYDERIMRSALAMVGSSMSLRRIGVDVSDLVGVSFDFPDMGDEARYVPWVAVYDLETSDVRDFRKLPEFSRDNATCGYLPLTLAQGEGYAVFLHDKNGEIVAVGRYTGD